MSSSMLNQSVMAPIGHGVGKPESSARPHDRTQNLPLNAASLPGSNSLKSSSHQKKNTLKSNYSLASVVEASPPWIYKQADLGGVPLDVARSLPVTNSSISTGLSPLCSRLVSSIGTGHADADEGLAADPVADLFGGYSHNLFSAEFSAPLTVTVSSAVELDQRQVEQIRKKMQRLTGFNDLRFEHRIDESLIAGFVVCYGSDDSNVIDLSVKGQLAQLSARIESSENKRVEQEQNWCFLT